jgi:hypothetical protein
VAGEAELANQNKHISARLEVDGNSLKSLWSLLDNFADLTHPGHLSKN